MSKTGTSLPTFPGVYEEINFSGCNETPPAAPYWVNQLTNRWDKWRYGSGQLRPHPTT